MRSPRLRARPLVVLVVLVVGSCMVVAAWSGLSLRSSTHDSDDRDAALEAARRAAQTFTTYDYRELDGSFDALLALGTENFRSSFGEAVKQLRPIIRREKARSAGEVVATALGDSTGDDSVMVLVAMDVRVDNRSAQQGEERRFRLRLAMQRVEGEWLLDEIATVT